MAWPALFISHGSPMMAVDPGRTGPALSAWAAGHGAPPGGILVVSPHWRGHGMALTTRARQQAWHDFGGFPRELYELRYDAPGAPALADQVAELLAAQGLAVQADPGQPLDHGAWVPLRYLYPDADVPVAQLSLDAGRDAHAQHALGRALAPLRERGVLVIGSGSLTHNLRDMDPRADAPPRDYVPGFQQWVAQRLEEGDVPGLLDWQQAPGALRAHPHDDHLMPFFVALGAGGLPARRLVDEVRYGALAMDSYQFG